MKIAVIRVALLAVWCLCAHLPMPGAGWADQAVVGPGSGAVTRAKFAGMADMGVKQAFNKLQNPEFLSNDSFMQEAVRVSFGHRRRQAMDLACNYLRLPREEHVEGKSFTREMDFHVAKSVLQAFPEEGLARLRALYASTRDAVTRGNVVLALGGMGSDPRALQLLLNALEEKEFYGGSDSDAVGYPMRVCDLAYNQIVAQYEIRGVLRTIGSGHRISVRDDHIQRLRQLAPQ